MSITRLILSRQNFDIRGNVEINDSKNQWDNMWLEFNFLDKLKLVMTNIKNHKIKKRILL